MSESEPDTATIRARITQLLFTTGMELDANQKGVILQFSHCGEIEPPIVLSLWDAKRLVCNVVAVLATLEPEHPKVAKLVETLWSFTDPSCPEWRERGDPSVGPWPPQPPSPRRRKRKP
ncbi:MAG TPA: hypothetical protein VGB55_05310 [Tepidisphaeraceae bacterium]|jgi:hypothetical protein